MKRWLLGILSVLLLIGALGATSVELFLRSDKPRQLVQAQLEKQTGLLWSIGEFRTGWSGSAIMRQVEVRLPLDKEALLNVPELRATHTAVLRVPWNGVTITNISLIDPMVQVARDDLGVLNVQRAIESMVARQASRSSSGFQALPHVAIHRGLVRLDLVEGDVIELVDISMDGRPIDALTWHFALQVPAMGTVDGRLSTATRVRHDVTFDFRDLSILQALTPATLPDAAQPKLVRGTWAGEFRNGALTGLLTISDLQSADASLSGKADISVAAGHVDARHVDFVVETNLLDLDSIAITATSLGYRNGVIDLDQATLRARMGSLVLGGNWDVAVSRGDAHAAWDVKHTLEQIEHSGRATFSMDRDKLEGWRLHARADTRGAVGDEHRWRGIVDGNLAGQSLTDFQGNIQSSGLSLKTPAERVDLPAITIRVRRDGPRFELVSVDVGGQDLRARGEADLDTENWSLSVAASSWSPPKMFHVEHFGPIDLAIQARGTASVVEIPLFELRAASASVSASGRYDEALAEPLAATIELRAEPDSTWSIAPDVSEPEVPTSGNRSFFARVIEAVTGFERPVMNRPTPPARRAQIKASMVARGSLHPLALHYGGTVTGTGVQLGQSTLSRIEATFHGETDAGESRFVITHADALQGTMSVDATLDHRSREVVGQVSVDGVDVAAAMELVRDPAGAMQIDGRFGASGLVSIPVSDVGQTRFNGQWTWSNVMVGEVAVGDIAGQARLKDGVVSLSDIGVQRDDGSDVAAEAALNLHTLLATLSVRAQQLPLELTERDLRLVVDGSGAASINLAESTVTGEGVLAGTGLSSTNEVGRFSGRLVASGSTVEVKDIEVLCLGGTIEGSASTSMRAWDRPSGRFEARGLDLARLRELFPEIDLVPDRLALQGLLDANVFISPALEQHAPGPVKVDIELKPRDAFIGTMAWRDSGLTIFAAPRRLIMQASRFSLADGVVTAWGRLSWTHDAPFVHVHSGFRDVSLDQVFHVLGDDPRPVPGKLSGEVAIGTYLASPHRSFGQAEVTIRESDLANVPLIAVLYQALRLQIGEQQPLGEGVLRARLDGDRLDITRLTYFNRGVDVISRVRVANIWLGEASPVMGFAVGTMRPLKNRASLLRDVDTMMKVMQSGAGSVEISGTIANHEIKAVPFKNIAASVRSALSGL